MTAVEDVLTQLKTVIAEIDQAAVAIMRAKAHVTAVHIAFADAGTGTQDTDMRSAITNAETGGKDLRKVATLLTQAIQDLADYADIIAPGAGIGSRPDDDVMPPGERIQTESQDRDGDRWLRQVATRTEDVTDSASETGKAVEGGTKWIVKQVRAKADPRPPGQPTTQVPVPDPPPPVQSNQSTADGPAALVGALLAAIVATNAVKRWLKRRR